ncbi:sulfate adenylyltransferase subunit / adenylylsulfate kinase [Pontimonas salivibrio]|uniref:Adenylyl-sulfate kinase n=1 Tax=Pontimonas salivibrio TaxID=1159327 RepID=A0A2L2BMY9_9MICO|nr:adenylyl-sulfate kinase [Pontimonas salivibrio]AVG23021.1 sulfate adenylyltransferase subunit / adenylylsulfate kinase [Pontimonas salivibrio]
MPQEIFHITSAGSVDDGKSTILARLLLDTGSVFEDQLGGIDPKKVDATTIADLLDGLDSEREQGITIDVAHRFFDSPTRRYHIADSPGHEQYTRNMATAASHADALLLVIDARVGLKPQTLTHLGIARKLGISRYVIAVNKMDLVDYKKRVFTDISAQIDELFNQDDAPPYEAIPVSGLAGDNVVRATKRMSWWKGGTLLQALDTFSLPRTEKTDPLFVIQYVQRVPGGGRRYLGSLLHGTLSVGDQLHSPRYTAKSFRVTELIAHTQHQEMVKGPAEISVAIDAEVDLERGDVLWAPTHNDPENAAAHQSEPAGVNRSAVEHTALGHPVVEHTDQFEVDLVWLDEEQGFPGRTYLLRLGHTTTKATITRAFDIGPDGSKAGQIDHLGANSLSQVNIEAHNKLSLTTFQNLRELGRLVLVDQVSGSTVAAGVVNHTLRRADNLKEHSFSVLTGERSALTGYQGRVAWFTGLSGSGKSTLANEVSVSLTRAGVPHSILDGDGLRLGLNRDLGFSEADRVENIRRAAEVAALMADSGLVVLVSLISPYRSDRAHAKEIVGEGRFVEVFVDTPLEICEQRDPKGLYQKARAGLIPNFTGIGSTYESPATPDIRIHHEVSPSDASQQVIDRIVPPAGPMGS